MRQEPTFGGSGIVDSEDITILPGRERVFRSGVCSGDKIQDVNIFQADYTPATTCNFQTFRNVLVT